MPPLKIGIIGAGGVGGFLAARLSDHAHIGIAQRGDHGQAIARHGLRLISMGREKHVTPAFVGENLDDFGPADIIIITVKRFDLEAAAKLARVCLQPHSLIIGFQNGIGAREDLATILNPDQIGRGVVHISSMVQSPGVIAHNGSLARFFLEEPKSDHGQKTARRWIECAEKAGLELKHTHHIDSLIWDKFIFLTAFSGMTALTRSSIGVIRAHPDLRRMFIEAMHEAAAIAHQQNISFQSDPVVDWQSRLDGFPASYRASMAEDLERGKRLELPWLSAAVVRMGEKYSIATPVQRCIAAALSPFSTPPLHAHTTSPIRPKTAITTPSHPL